MHGRLMLGGAVERQESSAEELESSVADSDSLQNGGLGKTRRSGRDGGGMHEEGVVVGGVVVGGVVVGGVVSGGAGGVGGYCASEA